MEKVSYFKNIKCEKCEARLLSVYVRSSKNFKSLENYYYCEVCKKLYKFDTENTEKAINFWKQDKKKITKEI